MQRCDQERRTIRTRTSSKLSSKRLKLPRFNRDLNVSAEKKARKYKKAKRSGREDH